MTWLDKIEVSIDEALERYPQDLAVASVHAPSGVVYEVNCQSLVNMKQMQLGHLPISTVVLPKTLSDILVRPHYENLVKDVSHHLSDYFPNFFVAAIYELQSLLMPHQVEAFIIGGITRDMLLSSERRFDVKDVDLTVEGDGTEIARLISENSKNFNLDQVYPNFGTAKLDYKNRIYFDVATTRKEIYPACGHLPEVVERGVPLEEDIIRRDLTINALALSILRPGEVIDCTGGLKDLEEKKIRLLKAESFFEDPSRIYRALKFAVRLDFEWGEDTLYLLDQFLTWMPKVYKGGGERIKEELYHFLCLEESPAKVKWLNFFIEKGLHRLIDTHLPPILDMPISPEQIARRIEILKTHLQPYWSETVVWQIYIALIFISFSAKEREEPMHRLGLTRSELDMVEKSSALLNENLVYTLSPQDKASRIYGVFHNLPMGAACVGIILSPQMDNALTAYVRYKSELESIKLDVSGDDIMKLGIPQGEQVGKWLRLLHQAKLQGEVHNRAEELEWLKSRITEQRPSEV